MGRALERVRCLSKTEARREFLGRRAASVRTMHLEAAGQKPPAHACLQLLAHLSHPPKHACMCQGEGSLGFGLCSSLLAAEQQISLSNPAVSTDSNTFPAPLQHERK